jgi:type II secretory pathway component PulM
MQNVDVQLTQLEKDPKQSEHVASPVALLSVLQKEVTDARLEPNLVQLKQVSNDAVEMQFQKVSFDKLMQLLIRMSKEHAVLISTLNVTTETEPGLVNANVVLGI